MPNHDSPLYYLKTLKLEKVVLLQLLTTECKNIFKLQVTQIHFIYLFFVEIDYSALWGSESVTKKLNWFSPATWKLNTKCKCY